MKLDEINFFKTCYKYRNNGASIREIINILKFFINYKRCWYLLKKWSGLGFYNYGVTLDLGWFELENMPLRYVNLLKQEKINNAVKDAAITLGVNPERIGLFSKLIDTTSIQIDENYNVDSESIKKAISDVLEMAPEFKKSPEVATGFKFGATKTETAEPKNTKNLTLRESLALRYNS